MGRWSRQLAPLFLEFVGVRDGENVLDVACGTGSLSATLAKLTGASRIVGIDFSKGLIEYARTQVADSRVSFELGDAQNLTYPDASFERCMALLAVDHIPDAPKATMEMRRVSKAAGVVATTMWIVAPLMSFTAVFGMPRKRSIRQQNGPLRGGSRTVLPKHFQIFGKALV